MKPTILAVLGLGGGELLIVLAVFALLSFLAIVLVAGAYFVIRSLNRRSAAPPVASASPSVAGAAPPAGTEEPMPAKANLPGAKFHDANMTGAEFNNVNLSNARFHNVNLSNVTITAAQMGGAAWKHIGPPPDTEGKQERQRPVRFEEMMLCDSTFRKVDLSNVRVVECELSGMTINGILVTELLAVYDKQPRSI